MDGMYAGSAKRSRSELGFEYAEHNGRSKRYGHESDRYFGTPRRMSEDVVYRVLCPSSKAGSIIGKGGSIIKSLRQETGADIRVEDGFPGADERVITIGNLRKNRDRGDKSQKDSDHDDGSEGADEVVKAFSEDSSPPVQQALFKICGRIVDEEDFSLEERDDAHTVTVRLLVPHNQIGCLIGKGGKVIEQMRSETAAQIRILPKEQLPHCGLPDDELIQMAGDWKVVKKALQAVASRLYDNPPKDRPSRGILSSNSAARGPSGNWPHGSSGFNILPSLSGSYGSLKDAPTEEFMIRILCPEDKIGSIIGRRGNLIRQIREETGAKIKIEDLVSDCDERVITISAIETPNSTISPTLEAALQIQHRIADLTTDKDTDNSTRLLVPSKNIGCLLGKGGSVITEMRKLTRANIRVMPKTSLPRCALESDELVQIVDDINVARDALFEIVSRLRDNLFKEYFKNSGGSKISADHLSPLDLQATTYNRMPDSRSSEDFHRVSSLNAVRSYDSYSTGTGTMGYQGGSGSSGVGPLSTYSSGAAKPSGLYGRSGLVASVASKTLEIRIPSAAVGAVLGKGGSNITHIRQVSGAKVKLHEVKSGASERIVEVAGTPEQTQTAQSLLEAYIAAESSF